MTFTNTGDFSDNSYSAKITNLAVGGDDTNAYFLKITSTAPGGTVINFSDRFTLSGMTGQFSDAVKKGLATVSGTSGPAAINNIVNPPAAAAPAAAPAGVGDPLYQVAYTMQTGSIRYAPMPSRAPSKITANGSARQYPTSAYTIWSRSGMPDPNASQTVTEAYTWSESSREPTVSNESISLIVGLSANVVKDGSTATAR